MQEFLRIVSALSDPSRVRLLMQLVGRELCVCNLVDLIGLADSTVSKHMSILRDAGLVASSKRGRWVYYRLLGDEASPLAKAAIQLAYAHLQHDSTVRRDGFRITELLRTTGESACGLPIHRQSAFVEEKETMV